MVNIAQEKMSTLIRDMARQLGALPASEFDDLVEGRAKVVLSVVPLKPDRTLRPIVTGEELSEISKQLLCLETREAGIKLLDERLATKDEVARFARHLDLSVQKSDTLDVLKSKIIEATIGYRLRSAAVQGT